VSWLWHALAIAGSMTWEILWALILGFALSAVVHQRNASVMQAHISFDYTTRCPRPGRGP
jgi:hypothetical protein